MEEENLGKRFCDIYALLEAPQEIFFGNIPSVAKLPTEVVKVSDGTKEDTKVYFSPTKRRGIDRRTLLWTKVKVGNNQMQFQDAVKCGLPETCRVCVVCGLYGGISTRPRGTFIGREEGENDGDFMERIVSELEFPIEERGLLEKLVGTVARKRQIRLETLRRRVNGVLEGRDREIKKEEIKEKSEILEKLRKTIDVRIEEEKRPISITSRVEYGGGVAVQSLPPEWKQRLSTTSRIVSTKDVSTPFKVQYGQPSLLFPVYYHMFFIDENEIGVVAYAFKNSLSRYGAGHPKGFELYHGAFKEGAGKEPMLVIDEYLIPRGDRVIISPMVSTVKEAEELFRNKTLSIQDVDGDGLVEVKRNDETVFIRRYGRKAYERLLELVEIGYGVLEHNSREIATK